MRSPHLYDTLRRFCLGAFAAFHKDLDSGADLPFAFEEHGTYGRPTLYEYRPLVRGFVEARAERLFARDDVRQARRRPAARAGGADLRARARHGAQRRSARALPLGARAAPRAHRRRLRRLRLGRQPRSTARTRSSRSRSSAKATRTARSRRSSASRAARRSSSATAFACAPPRPASSPRCGPRRAGSCRATSAARPTASACSSSSARSRRARATCPTRPASSPTPSPRSASRPPLPSPQAPCCSSGSTGARTASARCCRSPRPRRPASRRGSTRSAASVAEKLRPQLALADDDARARRRARPLGALALPGRPVPRRAAEARARRRARRRPGVVRGRHARAPPCSARRRRSAPTSSSASASPTPDLVRRLLLAVLLHGNRAALLRELDGALLGLRAGRDRVAQLRAS